MEYYPQTPFIPRLKANHLILVHESRLLKRDLCWCLFSRMTRRDLGKARAQLELLRCARDVSLLFLNRAISLISPNNEESLNYFHRSQFCFGYRDASSTLVVYLLLFYHLCFEH